MEEQFLARLKGMELGETVSMDMRLEELENWDSISLVNFGAIAYTEYGVVLTAEQIKAATTIGDLYRLVQG